MSDEFEGVGFCTVMAAKNAYATYADGVPSAVTIIHFETHVSPTEHEVHRIAFDIEGVKALMHGLLGSAEALVYMNHHPDASDDEINEHVEGRFAMAAAAADVMLGGDITEGLTT